MIEISGAYDRAVCQKSCSTHHTLLGTVFFCWLEQLKLAGMHFNTVICCYRNLISISCVFDICNFVRLDTGVLVIFEYFWGPVALEIFRKLL